MHETFLKLEEDLAKRFLQIVFSTNSPSIMDNVDVYQIFEGKRSLIQRPDGEEEEIEMKRLSVKTEIHSEKILYGTIQDILKCLQPVGEAMKTEQEKVILEAADKATEETGNIVEGKDRTLSHEMILEALAMTQIDFDRDGKPMFFLYCSPSMYSRIQELTNDPKSVEFKNQYDELIKRKRSEWRAREANRVLVG